MSSTPHIVVLGAGYTGLTAAKLLAKRTGATFLDGGSGHGWALLTSIDGLRPTRAGRSLLEFAGSAGTTPPGS